MKIRSMALAAAAAATLATSVPAPVSADGAASTRNILLLGGAAAAYLIISHNRKVHEREAEAAQRQASLEEQNDDAWSAYRQAESAYNQEVAVNRALEQQLAYSQKQLAAAGVHDDGSGSVQRVSYGWGTI